MVVLQFISISPYFWDSSTGLFFYFMSNSKCSPNEDVREKSHTRIPFHQINLMKNSKSKLKSTNVKKK